MNKKMIDGIRKGIMALRENHVEPMGLSITPYDGSWGWGLFKFKALPGHPKPGNAGGGWSHPAYETNSKLPICAPKDWPAGASFPLNWETTLDEVKAFALDVGKKTGFGTDFNLEAVWKNTDDMTVPGQVGTLSDIVMLRGGAEHYAYYPETEEEISYVGENGKPVDKAKEAAVRDKFKKLKSKERAATDGYMQPPAVDKPVIVANAWYVDTLPDAVVAEMPSGKLVSFSVSPFRAITEGDMTDYDGQHPRRLSGVPVPAALYPYYGIIKSEESLSEVLRIRLSPSELEKIKAAASADGLTVSEYARGWIRRL